MFVRSSLFSSVALLLLASPVLSDSISVPNGSFEAPVVAPVNPYASPDMSVWQKSPPPAWWAGTGATSDQWYQSVGEFYNLPFAPYNVDNVDGSQAAYMFSNPGQEISQELSNTFQVGQAYQLDVGIQGGAGGMAVGCPMQIGLYYLDGGNQVMVGTTTILNDTTLTSGQHINHLPDRQLTIPAVNPGDAWAGKAIGIAFVQTADFSNFGGYWDIDNVQLQTVPEPGTMTLLVAGMGLLALRKRCSRGRQTGAAPG